MVDAPARPRVFVTRAIFPDLLERLDAHFEVESNQADLPIEPEALAARVAGFDGLLCVGGDRIDEALFAHAAKLRGVSTISVGTNHIDLEAARKRGIVVTNTPDVLTETTADMGWALMMAAARRVTESEHWLRAGHWKRWSFDQFLGADVHHATLGILGMGRIGQALAHRAVGFSMPVIYHNRTRLSVSIEDACRARYVTRDELFATADHLILVLPYTRENHHVVGPAELAVMKPTATLTNIARGGLVDEHALADALESGRLGAAGLDVFEGEPAINPRLLGLSRVALTPHLGSASHHTRRAMGMLAIENLIETLSGREPPNRVS
jgi:glyoxylate/hydroxypyruvate/2-ketogluconate reductase